MDTFVSSLEERILAYEKVDYRFGFLSRFNELSKKDISKHAKILTDMYKDDLDDTLEGELSQFQEFFFSYVTI